MRSIIPTLSTEFGRCDYCLTANTLVVTPSALGESFAPVIGIYEQVETGGLPLVDLLRSDWSMFGHARMDGSRARELLSEVLDDGEVVRKLFKPSDRFQSDSLQRWMQLRDELMYRNRYFPEGGLDLDRFSQLLAHLIADDVPTQWYRARIQEGINPIPIENMSAPPKRVASHGRANPPGIPYLYLGSSIVTAVSEIRPHTGELASVADFSLPAEAKLVDLRSPRALVSPFLLGDEDQIGLLRSDIAFLEHLGNELTRPVLPQGAAIDYVPSQYLCEFIKKESYDGVIYKSAMSDGINLALFDPAMAVAGEVQVKSVLKVAVEVGDA